MPSEGLAEDQSSITVSPATKWDQLYEQLDPLNLTVVGGRVAGVGVGGLVLGCGISYVSSKHGFACDNVENFQVLHPSEENFILSATVIDYCSGRAVFRPNRQCQCE